jgi:hypothetical protein
MFSIISQLSFVVENITSSIGMCHVIEEGHGILKF